MDSMTTQEGVVVGVDAHTDTHDAAALDRARAAARRASRSRPTAPAIARCCAWLERVRPVALIGVESTGCYAAGLVRYLRADGVEVLEVNQPHAHTRRRRGKSDPIDAETGRPARAGRRGRPWSPKHTDGIVESIRQLRVARDGAVKARTAALQRSRRA